MTRRRHAQLTLTQIVLFGLVLPGPESLMDPTLRRIDTLLDDAALVDAVMAVLQRRRTHSARRGRASTPAEVVLRMLVLKHLRQWSYERLEWEVRGNLVYRRFCRIDAAVVPDAKTMVRYGRLLDGRALRAASGHRAARWTTGRRMRVDTTVVEAPIHHPTDSGLCEDVIRVVRRGLVRLARAGVVLSFQLRQVWRSTQHRVQEIAQALRLRGDKAREAIKKPYRGLLRITGRVVRQAAAAVADGRRGLASLDRRARTAAERVLGQLAEVLPRARQVIQQTRARVLRGVTDSAGKIISVFEPWAQILRRGKPHRPTEFGVLVKVQEADHGVVTDVDLVATKHDAALLVPAVEKHIAVFGAPPDLVATDRGFFSLAGERQIQALGVRRAVLPHCGGRSRKRIEYERQRWFRKGRAWRAGGEARIARLKNVFGMSRSRYRGEDGARRTVLWAAIANNLVALAAPRP
jgi:IS5 family transposase